ncbi:energy transducer TonB [Uliginosibacterium sp. 31-12]|uniref:energy transducer TonB n=1 Tax=Uliginosibacterium sp. 31-12 TaxID=3062781 RepID=UPI0026E4483B|nr:energy transducer TonB [Uliginosibacterium sp. 31-12]MDO6386154.1 TonB family protein [Uliginosibacterium sp. 31-12]
MNAPALVRPLFSERSLSLAVVIGFHLLAGFLLLRLAQPVIQQMLGSSVQIELIAPPAPELKAPEPPKPLPPKPQQRVEPVKRTIAPPLLQTRAPVTANTPVIEAAPTPKEATPAVTDAGAPQAAPGPVSAPSPEPVQAPRFDAAYLQNPAPAYPSASRNLGEQGRVLLRVQVGEDGRPLQVLLDTSSGYPRLDRAAREAVSNWRFTPGSRGGKPVVDWVRVPVLFELNR